MRKEAPTLVPSCAALPPEGAAEARGGPSVRRRSLLLAGAAGLLAGCGFQLRKAPDFVFASMVLNAPESSPLAAELRRQMAANAKVDVLGPGATVVAAAGATPPAAAADQQRGRVQFDLLQEQREKVVVGLNASGQVREYQVRLRIRFRLRGAQGKDLIPDTELLQQRDISFNEGAVLAKEAEEALLYRDMQGDLVQQLMRRLAAVKTL
jgi:LPS-assembly lipoprotein